MLSAYGSLLGWRMARRSCFLSQKEGGRSVTPAVNAHGLSFENILAGGVPCFRFRSERRSRPSASKFSSVPKEFGERVLLKTVKRKWLVRRDSNPDSWHQKPESCRWTTDQFLRLLLQSGSKKAFYKPSAREKRMVGREGVEPATLGLKVPCSTS